MTAEVGQQFGPDRVEQPVGVKVGGERIDLGQGGLRAECEPGRDRPVEAHDRRGRAPGSSGDRPGGPRRRPVAARAQASEVLVTSTVQMLGLGSEVSFTGRDLHTLKGVPDRWQLFAVECT